MDEFYEYWMILPEKSESIGQEIVRYKRNLHDTEVTSMDLSEDVLEFLQKKLIESPYPTNNIIYHIFDVKDPEKNQVLEEIIINTVVKLMDLIVEFPNQLDKKFKLYNLLSNIFILSDSKVHKLENVIIPALYDLKENHHLLDDVLYFALLSRSTPSLLKQYLEYEHSRMLEKFDYKTIFLKCYYQRRHWIDLIFKHDHDDTIKSIFSQNLYDNLSICKMVMNDTLPKQVFTDINPTVIQNKYLQLCYMELSRQKVILNFLTKHSQASPTVDTTKSHIMTQLIKQSIPFNMENYETLLELLKYNYENNMLQLKKYHAAHTDYDLKTEMQLFNEYMIIKLYLQKILQKDSTVESNEACLNHIRRLLKTINDGSILFNIMQSVLFMVFVRYEHVRKTKLRQRTMAERSSYSSSQNNNSNSLTDISDGIFIDSYNNHGFICTQNSLELILNSLRLFLMSLDITEAYKNCDNVLKKKFSNLLQAVDLGLWKLQLISVKPKKTLDNKNEIGSSIEWLVMHEDSSKDHMPKEEFEKEKISLSRRSSVRKKLRKRSKVSELSEKSNDVEKVSAQDTFATDRSMTSINRIIFFETKKNDNFIAKMLMSPESMIALCVRNKDDDNMMKIIKDYNLKNTQIEKEVKFIKGYEEILNTLKSVAQNYIEIRERELLHNVGNIRNFAEASFEAAKFVDLLENYCFTNDLNHIDQNEILLDKLMPQMPNLHPFKKTYLMLTTVLDIMISLPEQSELTSMIIKFIGKKWTFLENEKGDYFIGFLKKIIQLHTYAESQDKKLSLTNLLSQEICSLDPVKFKVQMENRENFKNILDMNFKDQQNEESVLQDLLSITKKFKSNPNYFGRVYAYAKNVRNIVKFITNEHLSMDEIMTNLNIYDLIGKIIYVQQYNPNLLTRPAFDTNINLLYALAIAGGTEFLSPSWKCQRDESDESKIEYPLKYFNISNTNILFYVKKSGSFLVAYLIKEIQGFNYKSLNYDEPNYLERLKALDSVQNLRKLYGDNATVTALNYDYVEFNLLYHELCKLDENGKLNLLAHVSERNVERMRCKFNELKDSYVQVLMEQDPANIENLLMEIGDIHKYNELLLKYIRDIKDDVKLESLLAWSLCSKNQKVLSDNERVELDGWLRKIKIYQKILTLFREANNDENINWINIMELAEHNTSVLINFLINVSTNLELCNKLLKFHPLHSKNEEVYKIFIEALNKKEFNEQHDVLFRIIQNCSNKFLLDFFDYSLDFIHNMESMKFLLNFLSTHDAASKNHIRYQKFQISCMIIKYLDVEDEQLWSLAAYPLILLEQMLMNSKIEILNVVIKELRDVLENEPSCNLCKTTNKNYQIGEILVYDFDAYHKGFKISNDCLDFLLKIYAAKALDFQIIDIPSQSNPSMYSGAQSTDTTIHVHQIPKEIPSRDKWVPDNEALFCMCCKKSKFSLLNRRHHCRRCGNVICGECSRKRILLPEKYNDLMVRCCDDCYSQMESKRKKLDYGSADKSNKSSDFLMEWKLTGDIEKDEMIRDEFNYEYSPNVGRCIAIICLHTINDEFTNFLLFHCHRLELLLHPINGQLNPEIDVILVGSMLKYLAKTAKLFGDVGESNVIIDQIDIILKLAENDCDSILSKASFNAVTNNLSTRDIINELIKVENWKLALDLSVKWDRNSTSGVFSAWAVSLIKGGQYKLAREKMALALQPVSGSSMTINEDFLATLNGILPMNFTKFEYKRSAKASPLLNEILEVIEAIVPKYCKKETKSSTKENPMDYLKRIMDGDYGGVTRTLSEKMDWNQTDLQKSPYFIESMYYLLNYGGNMDILEFFMRNNLIKVVIRFALLQKISYDMFIQYVLIPIIKFGRLGDFVNTLKQIDENFGRSKNYIISLCKYLDRKKSLHVLYQLQLLIEDNIRAALTSLKFYLDGSGNYTELNEKSRHLLDAKNHLQLELERAESGVDVHRNDIQLKWDIKSINAQINIISLQLEVSKYLANCELNGYPTLDLMPKVFLDKISLKTLLGKEHEKSHVAILLLICGHSIESSFGLCYRIIQECSLKSFKIYSTCTKYLARDLKRLIEVEKLINCIRTNASCGENTIDPETEAMCDDLICMAVEIAYVQHASDAKIQIDQLIKLISCTTMKIQCYINSNQLKTAFVHSAALNNLDYIRRIMRQAESTRQENIRRLCEKKLQQGMSSSMSSESGNFNIESTSASDHK